MQSFAQNWAMDWNSLKIFLAIATEGSLNGAAKALDINHSTVFRRLNRFEKELGGRLFERLHEGYQLTVMGEELLAHAREIEEKFFDLERHVVGQDLQPRGKIKITAPNNIAYRYLSRYLKDFRLRYPEIEVDVLASNLEFNMANRQADIAVRATPAPPDYLVGRLVRKIGWSVYSGAQHDHCAPTSLETLSDYPLIGAVGNMANLPGFVWLERHHAEQIVIRCDDLVSMSYFAAEGNGLAFLPDDQLRPKLKRL
ncbi:MAG: LysR family transcriptional regulator, partial [Gammaproteobacteria bacterium]|nr:LysR family transcriptional regulator [Gammaproteobacteria bacterium]